MARWLPGRLGGERIYAAAAAIWANSTEFLVAILRTQRATVETNLFLTLSAYQDRSRC